MALSNSLANIFLIATSAISLVIFVLLFIIKKKSTARVSYVAFLSALSGMGGSIATLIANINSEDSESISLLIISIAFFVISILVLAYCIVLCTFEPKVISKLVPHSVNEATKKLEAEMGAEAIKKDLISFTENDKKSMDMVKGFINQSSMSFTSENGMTDLLNYINTTIKNEINADGAIILMVDDFEDLISVKSFEGDFPPPYKLPSDMPHKPIRVSTNFKFASFPLRENIFGEIATSGKAELVTNPELDYRIYQNGPEDFLLCGTYIFVPMKVSDRVIGEIAFARKKGNIPFNEDDLKIATNLADFAAIIIQYVISVKETIEHNNLLMESYIATHIQDMLHPTKLPVIKGLQFGTLWNPVDGVCGDFYDILVSRKDRISFIMGDVAGKGINNVLVMSMLRAMLRLVVNTKQSAGKILEWVNHGIAGESFTTDHFASCALINYDPTKNQLELSTGGTTPIYYYNSKSNMIEKLSKSSEPIGVDKTSIYKDIFQEIKSGDIIFTYTDGLVETLNENGQQYSKESILKLVISNHSASAKDIANAIKADIKTFAGNMPVHDDQSLLVVKF